MDEYQSNGQEVIVQPAENIVEIDGGSMFTTSLTVAQAFEKNHFDVLKAIKNLECSPQFNERNFAAVEYIDAKGEMRPAYRISRDGFSFLAMGFTGKKAAAWKEKFLEAFNAMEQTLLDQQKDSIMEQAQEQEALPKEAQPIPYFFRSRKRIGKGGRAALEGILRLEALLQGDSLEHTEQRLCARMRVKSVGDLQECRLQEAIISAPKNDNYARLANYIAAGHEYSMDIQNEERIYDPQRNVSASQGVAGNRLRQLSECRLASYSQREQKREIADFLPADACPDRRAADSLRGNENLSKSMMPEKCLMSWCAGCWAGDDYDLAVQEVADTQALNRRTGKEKTYHLIISFHPEDEGKLTPDVFKQIEERFADALGLSEHQRHCGVHVNTENIHMHVAYNLIHPEKLTRVEPWRDYIKRDKLCRELEKEYGLTVDNGREAGKERGLGSKAAAMEAHSGQQSFEGFARQESIAVLASLEQCQSWEDVHQAFATHGLELRRRGAGLVIKDRYGRQTAKASTAHREFSLKKLEGRFGQFQAAKGQFPDSERRYGISPIQKAPDRGALWMEFSQGHEEQKAELESIHQKWRRKRQELAAKPLARTTRAYLRKLSWQYEREEIQATRSRQASNWLDFLRDKAIQGDEIALAILRSRQEVVSSERATNQQEVDNSPLSKETKILENAVLSPQRKRCLTSVALMEKIVPGVQASITTHGNIVYRLPQGGKIIDTGRQISFSQEARETALAYMSMKWNVKSRTKDNLGETFTLADGTKISLPKGQNRFGRPKKAPQRRNQALER